VLAPYHAAIQPEWIDYNGHLRDAYYGVALSRALDDLMEQLGLDAAYRERTHCTLYTLELHMHYLHEVKAADALQLSTVILDADAKRMHVGCRFATGRSSDAVALGEALLLHVHQGAKPSSAAFPAEVERTLQSLKIAQAARAGWGPGSRKIELQRRP
jgi:acyl-CoA thioester hydrolase